MRRRAHAEEHENHERWLVSYADFITLLFAFFVVMYSLSTVNEGKYRVMADALTAAFGGAPRTINPVQVGNHQQQGSDYDRPSPIKSGAKQGPSAPSPAPNPTLLPSLASHLRTGQPIDFVSRVDLLEPDGSLIHREDIRVNHPARIEGLWIHQSSFGWAPVIEVTDGGETVANRAQVRIVEQPGGVQHLGVGDRGAHVVLHQPLVERVVVTRGVREHPLVEFDALVPEPRHSDAAELLLCGREGFHVGDDERPGAFIGEHLGEDALG